VAALRLPFTLVAGFLLVLVADALLLLIAPTTTTSTRGASRAGRVCSRAPTCRGSSSRRARTAPGLAADAAGSPGSNDAAGDDRAYVRAMSVLASAAVALLAAGSLPSDADTPTDAPSAWNDFLPWLLLGVGVFAFLLLLAVGVRWRRNTPQAAPPPPAGTAPAPPRQRASTRDIAVLTFEGTHGAERAFARVRDDAAGEPWLLEVAFVERHRHGQIVVRGTFAGRYLDVEELHGRLLEGIDADVPEGSSAVVVFAPTDDVDAMVDAFGDSGGQLTRHRVSAADAAALEAAVAQAPAAAPPPAAAPAGSTERSAP
jgi:hypothetical protein